MKEITVNIEGKEYTIDIEKAKSLGILKDKTIKDFQTGDVYFLGNGNYIIIVPNGFCSNYYGSQQKWNFAGLEGTLNTYSTFGRDGADKKTILTFLNQQEGIEFIKNINADIAELISIH
jgi:hypothetical protein